MQTLWKTAWLWKKGELRLSAKERINETKTLKKEAENKKGKLLNRLLEIQNKFSELFTDLEYEKYDALNNIAVLESKLRKLEISPDRIDTNKNSVLLS